MDDEAKREITEWRKLRVGWYPDADYTYFSVWWDRINSHGEFEGIITKYDRAILYPIFELYAMDRRVLGGYAQLLSVIRLLQSNREWEKIPLHKAWILYLSLLWGHLLGHRFTGHRLEYAHNMAMLQRRPLMIFIRTAKLRYIYLCDRLHRWREYRRIRAIYDRHNDIRKRGQ